MRALNASLSFLSAEFILLALVAIVLVTALRGRPRQLAFLGANLVFLWRLLLGPLGTISTVLFILVGYVAAQLGVRRSRRGLGLSILLFTALFVYMRRYDFVAWLIPDSWLTTALRTVGLSFAFFKVVHVMIDAYSGTLGRVDLLTYLNYGLNFTTFMMGPIQRYQDHRDQWEGTTTALPPTFESQLDSLVRILLGAVKSNLLSPFFLGLALQPDTDVRALSLAELAMQCYAFWFFLYLNFSGYCDVAIGMGSLMGIRPPENFNKPFLARNISDFWQRQHRSLTLWLTDYVFNPLYAKLLTVPRLANHKLLAANLALMTTMLVSGLWHGTTLSFLLFGLVHGLYFVIYRSWDHALTRRLGRAGTQRQRARPLMVAAGVFLTFNATAFAFLFFRLTPERVKQLLAALLPS